MKKKYTVVGIVGLCSVILFFYRFWLSANPLSSGDWSFHFPEDVSHFLVFPSAWLFWFGGGLGGNGVFLAGLETYFLSTARILHAFGSHSWAVSERVIWYIPFLLLSFCSSIFLAKTVMPSVTLWWLTPIIFLTNSYILMIVGGGQMGIAMAYAAAPLMLACGIRLYKMISPGRLSREIYKQAILTGMALSLVILFDPRIAYIIILATVIYWAVVAVYEKSIHIRSIFFLGIPFVVAGIIHAFWVLPLVVFRVNPIARLGDAYSSLASVKFFSFADFSHALSLLHPNWPENIFGKVYFLQPEFLFIPIVAWMALWGVSRKKETRLSSESIRLISFSFIALVGIFLTKGANDPWGGVYLWFFSHVPGFNVFRDPTKFYLLIAIAYSILIPAGLSRIRNFLPRASWFFHIPVAVFIVVWLFTIRQFITGQLSGTFAPHAVPRQYEVLKDAINTPDYFRTLWAPHVSRYGFSTYTHPAIDIATVLNTGSPSAVLAWLDEPGMTNQLARWSVKYVVLPYDSQGEIFVDDRKYSERQRNQFQTILDANSYLKKASIPGLDASISLYELVGYKDHVWLEGDSNATLTWHMMSPSLYTLYISGVRQGTTLVFSESYDPHWAVRLGSQLIYSKKTPDMLNSFVLPSAGNATATLEYTPQQYVWYGLGISVVGLVVAVSMLMLL